MGNIYLPACDQWTFFRCLLQEIDLYLEANWKNLHDSFGDLRIKSFELHLVLVEHDTSTVQVFHACCDINFC